MAPFWARGWVLCLFPSTGKPIPRLFVAYILTHTRDREWQQWPVTIVTGAYIGYAVGKLLGGTLLKGKKVMFE